MAEIVLSLSGVSATVSTRGAALVALEVSGTNLIGLRPEGKKETFHGSVLSPWQNRLAFGSWQDPSGKKLSNPINEPELSNALHGLLFDEEFLAKKISDSKVLLSHEFDGTEGFPFKYLIQITYEVTSDGISCSYEVLNKSNAPMPFIIGFHPYLAQGKDISDHLIRSSAKTRYQLNENKIPVGKHEVQGTKWDLSEGIQVATANLDDFFTDLNFVDGIAKTYLEAPTGKKVVVWQDETLPHLIIYTTSTYPSVDGEIAATAIEPASAPANALQTGEDVLWLESGETRSGSWGITLAG